MGVVSDWQKVSLVSRNFTKILEIMAREARRKKDRNEGTFDFIFCYVMEKSGKGYL